MMNQETIHIRKLTTGYPGKGGTKIVAKDIDATIRSGELTCLLGANGVGKSTLLRTLSAFQPPVGGEIEIMGKKLTDYTDKQLATVIGVVLTEKCSLRNMTVEELVGMGRSPYTGFWGNLSKEDKNTVNDAIALVRIEDLKYRMVHTLSDGERQKVMIAKALAQETPVIFLDEPTAGVDPKARREFWQMLHQLSDRGISILVSTHYMDEAERCHKVAYLSYGRLLANGTIASIIASQNLITMRTSGAGLTLLESQLQRLPDIEQTVIFGNQLYITSRDEAKLKSALFAFTQQGYEFCKVDTNLEDAFTYLMKNNCEKN